MKNKYRIVKDHYLGYECQIKRWWFPVWYELSDKNLWTNTFPTIDEAKQFIEDHKKSNKVVWTD